jgi:hypothetical protein
MSLDNLKISTTEIDDVYKPIEIVATEFVDGSQTIKITNFGDSEVANLGVYVSTASNVGDVDNPADYAPHIDYQQVLTWGTQGVGGITIYYPSTSPSGVLVKRGVGSSLRTKIPLKTMAAGETLQFKVEFSVPLTATARRLFVNISVG